MNNVAKDEPGDELMPVGETYRQLDLGALSKHAQTRPQRLWDIATEAMRDAEPVVGESWRVSLGTAKVKVGKSQKTFTLLQRDGEELVYLVPTDSKRPSDALLHIGVGGALSVDDLNSTQSFDPAEVAKLIEPIAEAAASKRRNIAFDLRQRRQRHRRIARNTVLGISIPMASVVALIALIWFLAGAIPNTGDGYTTQAIQTKYTYAADGKFHVVHWSEQFDRANIKTLMDNQDLIVPYEPRAVDVDYLDDFFDSDCDIINRDVRVGDKFRAVFSGQGGDGFKIKLDPRDNTVEICRTASQDTPSNSTQRDTVVLQQAH